MQEYQVNFSDGHYTRVVAIGPEQAKGQALQENPGKTVLHAIGYTSCTSIEEDENRLQCPSCGSTEYFQICSEVWVKVCGEDELTVIDESGDREYGSESACRCHACQHQDTLAAFRRAAEEAVRLDDFTRAYLVAALWSSNDEDGTPLDQEHDIDDIDRATRLRAIKDCNQFQTENAKLLAQAYELYAPSEGYSKKEQAGHDFWLTRNGHGVGFWDRGLGEVGEQLTAACKKYPQVDLYIGDDGKVYA